MNRCGKRYDSNFFCNCPIFVVNNYICVQRYKKYMTRHNFFHGKFTFVQNNICFFPFFLSFKDHFINFAEQKSVRTNIFQC